MTSYIPYSIRHNITDPDLARFLDDLEREMGKDISPFPQKSKCNFMHSPNTKIASLNNK